MPDPDGARGQMTVLFGAAGNKTLSVELVGERGMLSSA